jgi:hypothetical protein
MPPSGSFCIRGFGVAVSAAALLLSAITSIFDFDPNVLRTDEGQDEQMDRTIARLLNAFC